MFFFEDDADVLQKNNPIGEHLAKLAADTGMLLMACTNADMNVRLTVCW